MLAPNLNPLSVIYLKLSIAHSASVPIIPFSPKLIANDGLESH